MKTPRIIRLRELRGNLISNTRRVGRVLSLIKFLSDFRSIKDIAKHLDIHHKSVNRYLNLLVQLGFKIEVGFGKYHLYRIINVQDVFKAD